MIKIKDYIFNENEKRVGGSATGFPKKYWFDYEMIPIINKQIEELGWNDVKD